MNETEIGAAIYLAGHGSKSKPRLIELQYQRIMRYRRALLNRWADISRTTPAVFLDLQLPPFGMGHVDFDRVPGFLKLYEEVKLHRYGVVLIDLDEVRPGLTPDYESAFVRFMLETAGASVLNAFTDDRGAFTQELKDRCGQNAREYEVTDGSDFINFFPSLASDVIASALYRELDVPIDRYSPELQRINDRVENLKRLRPYAGGGNPFVESRLSADWRRK